jgi:transcription elongation factor Elf1
MRFQNEVTCPLCESEEVQVLSNGGRKGVALTVMQCNSCEGIYAVIVRVVSGKPEVWSPINEILGGGDNSANELAMGAMPSVQASHQD